jgi:hypothetical protein
MPRSKSTKSISTCPKKAKWLSSDDATLIKTLQDEQEKGNQADNNWKKVVWTACEHALAGSELVTATAPKKAKGYQDHWSLVCPRFLSLISIYLL